MCPISKYVNSCARHCARRPPKPNHALRAFIAAQLLREGWFGIKTIAATSLISGISRPSVQAAVLPLQYGDDALITNILNKRQLRLPGKDKEAARQRALQLFPRQHALLARRKDHGRAEAALIVVSHLDAPR